MVGYEHHAPWDSGRLPVSDLHKISYEQYGQKDGKTVLFLHGGPGGHTTKTNTKFFDPKIYRVVLHDQRGAGKSTPAAELRENQTQFLIEDIELLRKHLGIEKWHMVFGGSWGSTLGLLYAQAYPDTVGCLVLRGIFLCRKADLDWTNPRTGGAAAIHPDAYDEWVSYLPEGDRGDPIAGYTKLIASHDKAKALEAARTTTLFDLKRGCLNPAESDFDLLKDDGFVYTHAKLELGYIKELAWLEENQILKDMHKIKQIPGIIVQGRYDVVCPAIGAWDLHKAWPNSKLIWSPIAGHSAGEPGTFTELVKACDLFGMQEF